MRLFKRGRVWYAQFYDAQGVRQTKSTKCHDRGAAEQVARRYERHGANPHHEAENTATLNDALDTLIEKSEERASVKELAPDTVEFYRERAGHLVRAQRELDPKTGAPVLPALLCRIEAKHVDAYISLRRREHVKATTISRELMVLRMSLRGAKRRGDWSGDLDKIMPEKFDRGYVPRKRWLPPAELDALLATLGNPIPGRTKTNVKRADRAGCVAFIVATNSRLGEVMRARPEDIDFEKKRVYIRGSKTEGSDRYVPIVTPWQEELLRRAAEGGAGVGGRLFRPWQKVVNDLDKACKRVGIAKCSPNDLRRTYTHWMRGEGVPADVVARAMGHVDSRMVERVYGALDADELDARMRSAIAITAAAKAPIGEIGKFGNLPPAEPVPAAPATVAPVYQEPSESVDELDVLDCTAPQPCSETCLVLGSSCWTRTSDPVINRPAASARGDLAFLGWCSAGVSGALPFLAKAVRSLSEVFDAAEMTLERVGA